MIFSVGLSIGVLVYIAFVFDLLGFLARDELWLRLFMLAAGILYIFYYYYAADVPLWDAMITNGALDAVNLIMIAIVLSERTTYTMTREQTEIYGHFPLMSPGQFRRLMKIGEIVTTVEDQTLTVEGEAPGALYFVLDGPLRMIKGTQEANLLPGCFIGEIAYLTGNVASAGIRVGSGARFLRWDAAALQRVTRRNPGLRNALLGHFNTDLARKVAASTPTVRA